MSDTKRLRALRWLHLLLMMSLLRRAGRFFAITLGSDSDSEEDSVESADAIADSAEDEEEASSRDESPPPHRVVALPP